MVGIRSHSRFLLSVIHVKYHNGTLHAAVLEVGGGDDDAVLGQQLPRLHFLDLATHQHVGRGKDQQLVAADVQRTVLADDLLDVVDPLGHVLDVMPAASVPYS